ncbi:MAG: hypothetical protein ABI330_08945 [Caldimonas sp.]
MSTLKELRWEHAHSPKASAGRLMLAVLLHGAGALLSRLAAVLAHEPAVTRSDPCFEFHAEAGAPDGALYVDGKLVGWLPGVRRL